MLRQVATGVLIQESEFCQSNAVVVQGSAGVLLIDAGVFDRELANLAQELFDSDQTVSAGFSTHPHWDHMLWHAGLGEPPRYATERCASTAKDRLAIGVDVVAKAVGIPEGVPLDLLGRITGLPRDTGLVPWDGPRVRILEHQAHAPGHAALLIEESRVLVAGDMLSDVLIPILDLRDAEDPFEDYLVALQLLEDLVSDVDIVIPGHGSTGDADQLRARIEQDRAYVIGLRDGRDVSDSRIGPSAAPGWEWVAGVHDRQLHGIAKST